MLPVFTRPRGSRNATFESGDTAAKDLNASARDSEFVLLKLGFAAASPDSLEAAVDVTAAGLKRPVHNLGVVQAFGAATSFTSSVTLCSGSAFVTSSPSSMTVFGFSSTLSSEATLGASRGTAFGIAGTTGTVDFCDCFGATGVVSPPVGRNCCMEEGVVGLVDPAFSDPGRLVKGVSGRGTSVSTGGSSLASGVGRCSTSGSGVVPCAMTGSSTGSADRCCVPFRFLRARLAGQGRSGLESHGS